MKLEEFDWEILDKKDYDKFMWILSEANGNPYCTMTMIERLEALVIQRDVWHDNYKELRRQMGIK